MCICHGDEWPTEMALMDHQIAYYSSEARRYQSLYQDLTLQLSLLGNTISEVHRRGQRIQEREAWVENKERELERKDNARRAKEEHTRRIRRILRQRLMEVEERERQFAERD